MSNLSEEELLARLFEKTVEPFTAEIHKVANHLAQINGQVARHAEEIFGDNRRGTRGLRPEMTDMHDLVTSLKASARTIQALIGILGVGNLAAVYLFVAR
jgi:hypothetical protein